MRRRLLVGVASCLALLLAVLGFVLGGADPLGTGPGDALAQAEGAKPVWVTRVAGAIDPPIASYLEKTINRAQEAGAQALVVEMDTPGGLDSSMRQIIQAELNSSMPVIFYVYPQGARAASAGLYILMGADVAAMAPGTNLGAAQPVSLTGDMDEATRQKAINDAAAYIRALATRHGRNTSWVERAVRESVSLTAEEAKAQGVIEFVAGDLGTLLQDMDGFTTQSKGVTLQTAEAPITRVNMSWAERFLHALVNPNVAFVLLLLGMYGIVFELASPGLIVPGVVGVISLLLAFYSLQVLPVSFVGVALVVVAMALFVAEVLVASYGLLGVGGTIALVLGGILLFNTQQSVFRVDWVVIALVAVISIGFFAIVVRAVARAHRRPATTGVSGIVGAVGVARQRLDPNGMVMVQGELWRAVAVDGSIPEGARVEVIDMQDMRLRVRREAGEVEEAASESESDSVQE